MAARTRLRVVYVCGRFRPARDVVSTYVQDLLRELNGPVEPVILTVRPFDREASGPGSLPARLSRRISCTSSGHRWPLACALRDLLANPEKLSRLKEAGAKLAAR